MAESLVSCNTIPDLPNPHFNPFHPSRLSNKVIVTGKKANQKFYKRHSGRPGGMKVERFSDLQQRIPERIVEKVPQPSRFAVASVVVGSTIHYPMVKFHAARLPLAGDRWHAPEKFPWPRTLPSPEGRSDQMGARCSRCVIDCPNRDPTVLPPHPCGCLFEFRRSTRDPSTLTAHSNPR
mgnify:CR=1 FL=1|jgi:hypothetical protein